MFCAYCGKEISHNANFCNKCGQRTEVSRNQGDTKETLFIEGSDGYKKIKNAGTSAEALGWFNLIFAPIVMLANSEEIELGYLLIIDLIYFIAISTTFIRFGRKLKKVVGATSRDVSILLWTTIFVLAVSVLGGKFTGLLFLLELYYLWQARSFLKNKQ